MNIGDHVKIREDLEVGKVYGGSTFLPGMFNYIGKEDVITFVTKEGNVLLCESPYVWNQEMLIPLPKVTMIKMAPRGTRFRIRTEI